MKPNLTKFTKISTEASKQKMCWDLTCTTCGCVELMKSFSEVIDRGDKPLNRYSHNNNIRYQEKLLISIGEINLEELMENSKYPDYLGHIGLLLSACQNAEYKKNIISKQLINQMCIMFPEDTVLKGMKEDRDTLKPKDLQYFEILLG